MTIRRRLLLILLGMLTLLLSAAIVLDYRAAAAPIEAAFDQALANGTLALAAELSADDAEGVPFDLPRQAIDLLRSDQVDRVYYRVVGADGGLLGGDRDLPMLSQSTQNPAFGDAVFAAQPVRIATRRVDLRSGSAAVTVAETTLKRETARQHLLATIVIADLAQLLAILGVVWLGVSVGLRPLLSLRAQIDARSARDLAALDERGVPGEVKPLTAALNRLFATVRATTEGQLRFLANAAHQLRTPLAGLQTQIELLIADPSAAALRPSLETMLAGTRRLGHTANQLLALARAEPSAVATAEFREVDLREIAEEAVALRFESALRRNIDLGVEARAARISGSRWLLRELLDNLVDNALAYTPAEGRVTVRCAPSDPASALAWIEVEDDGRGIAPELRERVVERFYRAPDSAGEGCGLGLAIVDEIARAHRATLSIGSGAGDRGTRVRVTFPPA